MQVKKNIGNMSDIELSLFHKYLRKAKNYLEFGAGSSTIYASQLKNLQSIYSVESSEDYVKEHVLCDSNTTKAVKDGKLVFNFIEFGETAAWGYPKDDSFKHLWPNYSLSIFNIKNDFDLVLIDGRFRVACALSTLLSNKLSNNKNTIILFHDFWNRTQYHTILKYVDVIDTAETLAVLKAKNKIDILEIQLLISAYQYIPSI